MNIIAQIGTYLVPLSIVGIVVTALARKVDVYASFIEGAKSAIPTVLRVLPAVAAMTIAVTVFRASGALEAVTGALGVPFGALGVPKEVLPLAFLRPFSGGAAFALLSDVYANYGVDSFIGRLASVMMGSSETLFYTVALYFGTVGVSETRHTISASLLGEFLTILAAPVITRLFFP